MFLPAVTVIIIPNIHTKEVLVISEIDRANALMYFVIATPEALNRLDAIMLNTMAANNIGLLLTYLKYTSGL